MSNDSFIREYFEGKRRRRDGVGLRRHQNLLMDAESVYSWGKHFPLATETKHGAYILNGDGDTPSTAGHQLATRCHARDAKVKHVEVPFSALRRARIQVREVRIISQQDDKFRSRAVKDPKTGKDKVVEEHLLGACVLKFEDKFFLSSTDDGANWGFGYFLTELPLRVRSVRQAFSVLKPEIVKRAMSSRKDVKRQGEWFFIPFGNTRKLMRFLRKEMLYFEPSLRTRMEKWKLLPTVSQNGAEPHHKVRDCVEGLYRRFFVRGTVRHTQNQHTIVSLGEVWHQAVPNCQVNSWSVQGRVD